MIIGISGKKQHGKDTVASLIQYFTTVKNPDLQEFLRRHFKPKINVENPVFRRKQFAEKLKQIVCLLIGCTMEQLEDSDFKEKELSEEWWYFKETINGVPNTLVPYSVANERWGGMGNLIKLTPRKLLQLIGTDCGRNIVHPNIWVNATMAEYRPTWNDPEPIEDCDYSIVRIQPISSEISLIHYNGGASEAEVYTDEIIQPNWIITDVRFPNEVKAIKDKGGIIIRVNRYGMPEGDAHESETALDKYTEWDGIILNEDMKSLTGQVINYLTYYKII